MRWRFVERSQVHWTNSTSYILLNSCLCVHCVNIRKFQSLDPSFLHSGSNWTILLFVHSIRYYFSISVRLREYPNMLCMSANLVRCKQVTNCSSVHCCDIELNFVNKTKRLEIAYCMWFAWFASLSIRLSFLGWIFAMLLTVLLHKIASEII